MLCSVFMMFRDFLGFCLGSVGGKVCNMGLVGFKWVSVRALVMAIDTSLLLCIGWFGDA